MEKNLYEILGVEIGASEAEIKMAFHNIDARYHPVIEKNISRKEKAEQEKEFSIIKQAYETLTDPDKRLIYDLELSRKLTEELTIALKEHADDFQQDDEVGEEDEKDEDFDEREIVETSPEDSSPEEETPGYREIYPLKSSGLKIFFASITKPVIWSIIFTLALFCINTFKDFSHKYTLVSEVLNDTVYTVQYSEK